MDFWFLIIIFVVLVIIWFYYANSKTNRLLDTPVLHDGAEYFSMQDLQNLGTELQTGIQNLGGTFNQIKNLGKSFVGKPVDAGALPPNYPVPAGNLPPNLPVNVTPANGLASPVNSLNTVNSIPHADQSNYLGQKANLVDKYNTDFSLMNSMSPEQY